jgi:hypothetical protein
MSDSRWLGFMYILLGSGNLCGANLGRKFAKVRWHRPLAILILLEGLAMSLGMIGHHVGVVMASLALGALIMGFLDVKTQSAYLSSVTGQESRAASVAYVSMVNMALVLGYVTFIAMESLFEPTLRHIAVGSIVLSFALAVLALFRSIPRPI